MNMILNTGKCDKHFWTKDTWFSLACKCIINVDTMLLKDYYFLKFYF